MGQVGPFFNFLGPHEIISFRKWKINPQTDRVNKYATLIANQVMMNKTILEIIQVKNKYAPGCG